MSITKAEFNLPVNDKTARTYVAAPEEGGPGVLVLHAWWGLKPFFKHICDELARRGFTALAPDYYQGRIATTIEEAKTMFEKHDEKLMGDTLKAAHDHLASTIGGAIGIVGFSMGASWALQVAANEPDVAATVLFYGAGEADYSNFKAKVLGHFSDVDEWEPHKWVRKMEADMKSAGVKPTLHIYPGAVHWFVEEDRPEFNPKAASLAWSRTYRFLKKNL